MSHPLDNPIWHALTGPHDAFALGRGRARRYPREVARFCALADDSPEAWADLARALPDGMEARLLQSAGQTVSPRWRELQRVPLLQMVATRFDGDTIEAPPVHALSAEHIDAATALVALTRPGPFEKRTFWMGRYLGIFEDRQLAAMAGERLNLAGYVELSAVCTDPRFRGRRWAGHLVRRLTRRAVVRGQATFLHVMRDNAAAVSLYRRLGFVVRAEIDYVWCRPMQPDRGFQVTDNFQKEMAHA